MSLPVRAMPPVPEETARVARAAFPKGNRTMQVRDLLGGIYTDADFAHLYPVRGRPALAPWQLAVVTVLQFAEGLSDRQAVDAVRSRIDWKYALGLELTDAGFDASVLSEFRGRLVTGGAEALLLDRLLDVCRAQGLLAARGSQRTDATHVLGALRVLSRLEVVMATMRAALNAIAVQDGTWLQAWVPAAWAGQYTRRVEEARLPRSQADRQRLAEVVGVDGEALLTALAHPETPRLLRDLPAVAILRQIWDQHYSRDDQGLHFRPRADLPPARALIQSPHESEARYARRNTTAWVGYKVHLTETCDQERPHLITQVTTTTAAATDVEHLAAIQAALARQEVLPQVHLVDGGYLRGADLVGSQHQYGVTLLGPVLPDTQWQARTGTGFAARHFQVDWAAQTATCPQGCRSRSWREVMTPYGPRIHVGFASADCRRCPSRTQCTRGTTGRQISLPLQQVADAMQAARQAQETASFAHQMARRAGIEGTISQGVRACGLRRARYRGLSKTHLQHVATATAMNLSRLADWSTGVPRATTRRSPFARLIAA